MPLVKANERAHAIGGALEQLLRLNASRRVHARQAAAAGVVISAPGRTILRRLQEDGPLSLGELAKRIHMDPAAAGRQVRDLAAEGLVKKRMSTSDARVSVVQITQDGMEVGRRITEVQRRHIDDVLAAWSDEDRSSLAELLSRLVDDLRMVNYRSRFDQQAG